MGDDEGAQFSDPKNSHQESPYISDPAGPAGTQSRRNLCGLRWSSVTGRATHDRQAIGAFLTRTLAWSGCVFDIGEAHGTRLACLDHPVQETEHSKRLSRVARIVEPLSQRSARCPRLSENHLRPHRHTKPGRFASEPRQQA